MACKMHFLDFAVVNGFVQSVAEPTRGANILDIVLTNEPLTLADVLKRTIRKQ